MITDQHRLYVQLLPDPSATAHLQSLQATLNPRSSERTIAANDFHITVLHIDVLARLIKFIRRQNDIEDAELLPLLDDFAQELTKLIQSYTEPPHLFKPTGIERFGSGGRVLVARYSAPRDIVELHEKSLALLSQLLIRCGLEKRYGALKNDNNFKHALTITPHVTLYKAYPTIPLPADNKKLLRPITLTLDTVIHPPK